MKILVCPGNQETPKSYPSWNKFLELVQGHEVRKIEGILEEKDIIDLVNWCDVWVSIDSFLPHLVAYHKLKGGVVIWGQSDPSIFGYSKNVNLLKDRKYLREQQFKWWMGEPYIAEAFVSPEEVVDALTKAPK